MYRDVGLLDIASLHPHSIKALNLFGEYTKNFVDLMDARIFIKHRDYDSAKELFGGKLAPYLDDPGIAKTLAYALKIAINSVYGLTSAKFDNPFRDPRNKNNIVALRGALFMKTLQDEVTARGYTVAHIKTDSIKIPHADMDIINFCMEFAKKYGYTFEHEATYDRMCLVNNSTYIAKYATAEKCEDLYGYIPEDCQEHGGEWTATAAQFAEPYVFKKLFSHEDISFKDLCVTKSVTTSLYLDMNEGYDDVTLTEKELDNREWNKAHDKPRRLNPEFQSMSNDDLRLLAQSGHNYCFVGRVGSFCPVNAGAGGGILVRAKDDKYYAVTGTKRKSGIPYRWLEAETVEKLNKKADIDTSYFETLLNEAVDAISKYGDFEGFVA